MLKPTSHWFWDRNEFPDMVVNPETGELFDPEELESPQDALPEARSPKAQEVPLIEKLGQVTTELIGLAGCDRENVIPRVNPDIEVGETDTMTPEVAKRSKEVNDQVYHMDKNSEVFCNSFIPVKEDIPEGKEGAGCMNKTHLIFTNTIESLSEEEIKHFNDAIWAFSELLIEFRKSLENGTVIDRWQNVANVLFLIKELPPEANLGFPDVKAISRDLERRQVDPILLDLDRSRQNNKRNCARNARAKEHLRQNVKDAEWKRQLFAKAISDIYAPEIAVLRHRVQQLKKKICILSRKHSSLS